MQAIYCLAEEAVASYKSCVLLSVKVWFLRTSEVLAFLLVNHNPMSACIR